MNEGEDDFDVLARGAVVGRIFKAATAAAFDVVSSLRSPCGRDSPHTARSTA
jgi:hypothetical protein